MERQLKTKLKELMLRLFTVPAAPSHRSSDRFAAALLVDTRGVGLAGSHFIFEHPENPLVIPVPYHSRDLREGT